MGIDLNRVFVATGVFMLVASVGGFLFFQRWAEVGLIDLNYLLALSAPFFGGLALLMFAYLRGGQIAGLRDSANVVETQSVMYSHLERLSKQLEAVQSRLETTELGASPLTAEERGELISALRKQIEGTLSEDFLHTIDQKYGDQARQVAILGDLDAQCRRTDERLREEIDSLTRRGNINLIIGVVTTLIAVAILASTVIFDQLTLEPQKLAAHFLPRFTLSIFIEIFSFFFLRLYSSGLNEIKYFQNELTNVEAQFIALRRAIQSDDRESLTKILQILAATERNFVLKKGETTVDLEKSKLDQQGLKDMLSAFIETVKPKK